MAKKSVLILISIKISTFKTPLSRFPFFKTTFRFNVCSAFGYKISLESSGVLMIKSKGYGRPQSRYTMQMNHINRWENIKTPEKSSLPETDEDKENLDRLTGQLYATKIHDAVDSLLSVCGQKNVEYMTFIRAPDLKIGEASFSDVYLIDDEETPQVVKVIALEGKNQLSAQAALLEIKATQFVDSIRLKRSDTHAYHFVRLFKSLVVKGYDAHLLKLWKQYDEENGSENQPPSENPVDQLYLVMFLGFGGTDLEHTTLMNTPKRIYSLFLQVILCLAQGEMQCQFEHRDLHWGNILVEKTNMKKIEYEFKLKNGWVIVELPQPSIKCTIIDFTLARYGFEDPIYNDLEEDPELFRGPGLDQEDGDMQFDVYRWMRDQVDGDWKGFHPTTNVCWIQYLLDKLESLGVEFLTPKVSTELKKRLEKYASCQDIVINEIISPNGLLPPKMNNKRLRS